MKTLLRFLIILFVAIAALKTNAQTYNYDRGVNTPTSSSDREAAERARKAAINNSKSSYSPTPNNSSSGEKSSGTNTTRDTRYETEYYTELEGNGLIPFYDPYAKSYGYADRFNTIIIKPIYYAPAGFKDGFAYVKTKVKTGYWDRMGTYRAYEIQYSLIDTKGKIVKNYGNTDFRADSIRLEKEKLENVKITKLKADIKNKEELEELYKRTNIRYLNKEPFGSYFKVQYDNKLGLIDSTGKVILPFKYDYIDKFNGDLTDVYINHKHGAVNREGKEIIPVKYDEIITRVNSSELLEVKLDNNYGVFNKEGTEIIPIKYDKIWIQGEYKVGDGKLNVDDYSKKKFKITLVELNKKWGAINKDGVCIQFIYEHLRVDDGNIVASFINKGVNLSGIIDKNGKVIIPIKYNEISNFYNGLAVVKLNEKYGVIDKNGKVIIPIKYNEIKYFYEDLAAVRLNEKWGFVDKTGKEVIPLIYEYAGMFKDGKANVEVNGSFIFIDKAGKKIK